MTTRRNPPRPDTSAKVATVASKLLRNPGAATKKEIKTVAAAALVNKLPKKK